MKLAEKLVQAYFDSVYNVAYDFTTARLSRFRKLQTRCVAKLSLKEGDRILCVGLGTGNEISHILGVNKDVEVTGVDYSKTALKKALQKAEKLGKKIDLRLMDARHLEFTSGSFDKVLCIHVMDFVGDNKDKEKATREILRVLKNGGQFVITYPSGGEEKLGRSLVRDIIRDKLDSGRHPFIAFWGLVGQMLTGLVYLPLLTRPKRSFHSRQKLESVISQLTRGDFQVEEYSIYQDLIAFGERLTNEGGKPDAS